MYGLKRFQYRNRRQQIIILLRLLQSKIMQAETQIVWITGQSETEGSAREEASTAKWHPWNFPPQLNEKCS